VKLSAHGDEPVLQKPISIEELKETIDAIIDPEATEADNHVRSLFTSVRLINECDMLPRGVTIIWESMK
jgi:hypothetical protein